MPSFLAPVLLGVFGAAIGSFCNVIIDRLPVELPEPNRFGDSWDTRPWGEVLGGSSRCSSCGADVRPYDNVPLVSWFLLRGRCRACEARIPGFHPVVEFAVPLGWIALWLSGATTWEFLPAYWLVPIGVAISVIDLRTFIVPTRLVWPAVGISVLLSAVGAIAVRDAGLLVRGLVGVATLAGPLFLIFMIHPRGMGFGDVRLATLLGWTIGAASGSDALITACWMALLALAVASVLGVVIGVLALGARGLKAKVPFGPPLVAGVFVCLVFASELRSLVV